MPPSTPPVTAISIYVAVIYESDECTHLFSSELIDTTSIYPVSIAHNCPICKKSHFFKPRGAYIVNTPSKQRWFESYCASLSIRDKDVKVIPQK